MSFWDNLHPLLKRTRKDGQYEDANYSILNAINTVLKEAEADAIESKKQSALTTATGVYLDTWGSWFGIIRKSSESDTAYRARIIGSIMIERGTIQGITNAIKVGYPNASIVRIYETWKNIFYLNSSKLNSTDCLQGNYYRFAVIRISVNVPIDSTFRQFVESYTPAGVTVLYEQVTN